jgi:NhaD family Na+/H+ antiporter
MSPLKYVILPLLVLALPGAVFAAGTNHPGLTDHNIGYAALIIFIVAYGLVMSEEFTHLRKSKPVILAAGIIWGMIAYYYRNTEYAPAVEAAIRHDLEEYAELMLFLLAAMTYINALNERLVFEAIRSWLVRKGFGFRSLFWFTGLLSFFISPIADNLTTALLMCAVVVAVGGNNKRFVGVGCVNIVVAANAGGAFSPFGDITTLMVWQKGIIHFWDFFYLLVPALVNFLVPASLMHFAIPDEKPATIEKTIIMKRGARRIMLLFLLTITTAVTFHNVMHLPPVFGMLTGLAYLQFFGYYLKKTVHKCARHPSAIANDTDTEQMGGPIPFDIFNRIARAEWDTLLFFYGVVMCVGGLGFAGYLELASHLMYNQWGHTPANISVGLMSAVIDNIPVMYAVLTMNPDMSMGQWLLVTLTAGVGGSMLSIGSAAGVALMGQARGMYTFFTHLKWTPVIALGYAASIYCHLWINGDLFNIPV